MNQDEFAFTEPDDDSYAPERFQACRVARDPHAIWRRTQELRAASPLEWDERADDGLPV